MADSPTNSTYDYSLILQQVVTKMELDRLSLEISDLLDELFEIKDSFAEKLNKTLSFEKRELILEASRLNKIDASQNVTQFKQFLEGLESQLKTIPLIEIAVAYEPTYDVLQRWSAWVKEQLKVNVALRVTVEHELIGGARIIYNGFTHDYSLRHILQQKIEKKEIILGQ